MTRSIVSSIEVARSCKITARAVRFYEQLGLIQTQRDKLNRRCVDVANQERLVIIARLRRGGVSLFHIGKALELLEPAGGNGSFAQFVDMLARERGVQLHDQMSALEEARAAAMPAADATNSVVIEIATKIEEGRALSFPASKHEMRRGYAQP